MKPRPIVLGLLLAAGTISLARAALQQPAPAAPAAAPAAPAAAAEGPKVAEIQKLKENLYMITGGGGNTAAFVTASGVVVVDTKLAGWGQAILDKIKTVTDKPVTMIINTHTHGDHTGSNEFFAAPVEIVTQEKTKANMARSPAFQGDKAKFLPAKTFTDKTTLLTGKDKIDLYHFGRGHTDGDTFVVFPALKAIHTGDMFARKATPFVDSKNGGSLLAWGPTLTTVTKRIKNVDTVITGHTDQPLAWKDLKEYAAFVQDFTKWIQAQHRAGKTVDEATAAYQIPAKYPGYEKMERFGGVKGTIQGLYDELAAAKPGAKGGAAAKPPG